MLMGRRDAELSFGRGDEAIRKEEVIVIETLLTYWLY